jgi:hypothetical protein
MNIFEHEHTLTEHFLKPTKNHTEREKPEKNRTN